MKKLIRDWKFILIVALIMVYGLHFYVLYSEEISLPSKNWSRAICLTEIEAKDTADLLIYNDNITSIPMPEFDKFITLYFENDIINYSIINSKGEVISNNKLDFNISNIKKIRASVDMNKVNLYMYNIQEKNLTKCVFNWETGEIISKKVFNDYINGFSYEEGFLIIRSTEYIKIIDNNEHEVIIDDLEALDVDTRKDGDIYHIALIYRQQGEKLLKYIKYNSDTKKAEEYKIDNLISSTSSSAKSVHLGIVGEQVHLIVIIKNFKSGRNFVNDYKFAKNNIDIRFEYKLGIYGSTDEPITINTKNEELTIITPVDTPVKRKNNATNLRQITFDDREIIGHKFLTKTKGVSIKPQYFKLKNNQYIQWTDIRGDKKRILFAGNNQDMIKMSAKLNINELSNLSLETLSYIIPFPYMMIVPVVNIFLPVFVLAILIIIFKLNWIERNQTKMLKLCIFTHIIAKLYFTHSNIVNNQEIFKNLPLILSNTMGQYTLVISTTIISLYCLFSYVRDKQDKSFIVYYTFYWIVDISLFTLVFFPIILLKL